MNPNVLFLRRMLKDFPVSVERRKRVRRRSYSNHDFIRVSRSDGKSFGEDMAARFNQIFAGIDIFTTADESHLSITLRQADVERACQQTTASA